MTTVFCYRRQHADASLGLAAKCEVGKTHSRLHHPQIALPARQFFLIENGQQQE
ncbi:MAG: hypothetical protein H6R18_1528 [Proteobacteria bacterium]|nr:hypothetical protein [Pseudomonadota bacterium]